MLQTFKDNLDDAKKKETETKAAYDTLSASKNSQLKSAQDGLAAKNEESGARNLNKQEAQDEVDMLKTRVENDEKFISQAEAAYATKSDEWKERCRLRGAEMASISEALSVLRSDDARDLSKKSMSSQGYDFLQESAKNQCDRKKGQKAAHILRAGAKKHSDLRLSVLASMLQLHGGKSKFEKVEKAIDKMVEDLHAEEDEDLEIKENCEADRMKNTKVAKKKSQEIDDKTAFISRKNAKIATLKTKIANLGFKGRDLSILAADKCCLVIDLLRLLLGNFGVLHAVSLAVLLDLQILILLSMQILNHLVDGFLNLLKFTFATVKLKH
jgi:hypothetical protein